MSDNLESLGKWIAVTACIVMGGVCMITNHPKDASGFVLGAVVLVVVS